MLSNVSAIQPIELLLCDN